MSRRRRQHRHWYERLGLPADPFADPAPVPYWDGERARLLGEILLATASAPAVLGITGPAGIGKSVLRAAAAEHFEGQALCLEVRAHVFLEPETLTRQLWEAWAAATDGTVRETGDLRELGQVMAARLEQGASVSILVDDADELPDACLELLVNLGVSFAKRPLRIVLFGREGLEGRLARHPKVAHCQIETVASLANEEVAAYLSERLQLAAPEGAEPLAFTERELARIVRHSKGVPGQIDAEAQQVLRDRLQLLPRRGKRARPPGRGLGRRALRWLRAHRALSVGTGVALLLVIWVLASESRESAPAALPPVSTVKAESPAIAPASTPAAPVRVTESASRAAPEAAIAETYTRDITASADTRPAPTQALRPPEETAEVTSPEAPDAPARSPESTPRTIATSREASDPSPEPDLPEQTTPTRNTAGTMEAPATPAPPARAEAEPPPSPPAQTRSLAARTRGAAPGGDAAERERIDEASAPVDEPTAVATAPAAAEPPAISPVLADLPVDTGATRDVVASPAPEAAPVTPPEAARADAALALTPNVESPADATDPDTADVQPPRSNLLARVGALFGGRQREETEPTPPEAASQSEPIRDDRADSGNEVAATAPPPPVADSIPTEVPTRSIGPPPPARSAARASSGSIAGEREILAMPDEALVLQVMVLSSATRAAVWLAQQQGGDYATYRRGDSSGAAWVILRGPFSDRSDAERAAQDLQQAAGVSRPFIRSVAEVRAEISPP